MMIMETLDSIKTRRSIRKFRDIPVEQDKVGRIIDAASWAPSSGNLQTWKFIVLDNYDTIKEIAEAAHQQYWINTAPVVIVVCSEPKQVEHMYGSRGKERYARQNCAAAIENMLLAATDLGLASCWVGAYDDQLVKDILGIPDDVDVEAIIPVGYAGEEPEEPSRYILYDMVFFNKWGARFKDIEWAEKDYAASVWRKIFEQAKKFRRNRERYAEKAKDALNKALKR